MKLWYLALKDLRLLLRDRMGAFFVIGFPVLLGLFFGIIFRGPATGGNSSAKIEIVVVDQDNTPQSQRLIAELHNNDSLSVDTAGVEQARRSVRRGERAGMIVIPTGFGAAAGLPWEPQPEIQIGVDPSKGAEGAMLEGMLMQAVATLVGERFQNPQEFLPSLDRAQQSLASADDVNPATRLLVATFLQQVRRMIQAADELQTSRDGQGDQPRFQLNLANIRKIDITENSAPSSLAGQLQKVRSPWDISFPQAMMWGIMGCVAGFSMSIARERSRGTLLRLRAAPLSKGQILIGKALACFLACLLVMSMMTILGVALGMRPLSFAKLAAAGLATSFCFVGIMMTMAVLGKTEESVAGTGWAANIVMAMFGGGMVPVMFMPGFVQTLSRFSPIYWSIRSIEGAIWRDFSWLELLPALMVLVAIGVVGIGVGAFLLHRHRD